MKFDMKEEARIIIKSILTLVIWDLTQLMLVGFMIYLCFQEVEDFTLLLGKIALLCLCFFYIVTIEKEIIIPVKARAELHLWIYRTKGENFKFIEKVINKVREEERNDKEE